MSEPVTDLTLRRKPEPTVDNDTQIVLAMREKAKALYAQMADRRASHRIEPVESEALELCMDRMLRVICTLDRIVGDK